MAEPPPHGFHHPSEPSWPFLSLLLPWTDTGEFTFKPRADGTEVTWSMTGKNGFVAKAFHMFMDCDKMVGGEFENGLASMKKIVESESARVAVG